MLKKICSSVLAILALLSTSVLLAGSKEGVTLDFEGLGDLEPIMRYYDGGKGGYGTSGEHDYGVVFPPEALAIIDADDGGGGNFANEPSSKTVAFFLEGNALIMNVPKGFAGGFSFFYSSRDYSGMVRVFEGENATGNEIATLELDPLGTDESGGDPTGAYNRWAKKSVSFPGIAKSVSFEGVADEIGFDDITFDPTPPERIFGFKMELEGVYRSRINTRSNGITVVFKNVRSADGKSVISDVCQSYEFEINDANGRGADQVDCRVDAGKKTVSVTFEIRKSGSRSYYFEDGTIRSCQKGSDRCLDLKLVSNFSVYGTEFDVKKDGFRFKNGSWADVARRGSGLEPLSDFAKAVDVVESYLSEEKKQRLWEHVGYTIEKWWGLWGSKHASDGLCYGMAVSSIAQFNHRYSSVVWGDKVGVGDGWRLAIDQHWDAERTKENAPYRPFSVENIYDGCQVSDVECLKKIVYYYVGQPYYYNYQRSGRVWVGNDTLRNDEGVPLGWQITNPVKNLFEIFKKGSPIEIRFSWDGGGHAVTGTQYIAYDGDEYWLMYDNNFPRKYTCYPIRKDSQNNVIFGDDCKSKGYYRKVRDVLSSLTRTNSPAFYGDAVPAPHQVKAVSSSRSGMSSQYTKPGARSSGKGDVVDFPFSTHLSVQVVGGYVSKVVSVSNQREVALFPANTSGDFDNNKAYMLSGVMGATLFLPTGSEYKLTLNRLSGYGLMKMFVKIPTSDGRVRVVNYEDVDALIGLNEQAEVVIGESAQPITTKGGGEYLPDFSKLFDKAVGSASNLQARVVNRAVRLSWDNPDVSSYKSVTVVRRFDRMPRNPNDGVSVNVGRANRFSESLSTGTKVYYAVFLDGVNGQISDPATLELVLGRYSIYGRLLDQNGNPVSGGVVDLVSTVDGSLIASEIADSRGEYAFSNLTNGDYILQVSGGDVVDNGAKFKVSVRDASREKNVVVRSKEKLFVVAPPEMIVGKSVDISWDGRYSANATIDISLDQGGEMIKVADSIPVSQKSFRWRVSDQVLGAVIVKAALSGNPDVVGESPTVIRRGDRAVLPGRGGRGGGGGGVMSLVFLVVICGLYLGAFSWKRFRVTRS